ncbi:MAG TPA: cupredoxin domain-containing protein [Candidatus Eisenbacteria bacterium]|nr:cupredoxin domain-containing protein [Candidatus Eisenbacteria bacterium]
MALFESLLLAALLALGAGCSRPVSGRVAVDVTEDGFVPATVHVRRGAPLTLVVTRRTDATCATRAEFATLGRGYDLPLGKPVAIPIPTDSARTIRYACPMDMYKGKVIVE